MNEKLNLLGSPFHQIAYVTNDFDRALEIFRTEQGVTQFLELRGIRFPTGPDGAEAHCHVALGRSGGMELEIIEPIDGDVALYRDPLAGDGFQMRFHHVAQRLSDPAALEAVRARLVEQGHSFPVDGASNGMSYFYADMRGSLGHYVEYIYGSPQYWESMGGAIPEN
jgi:hypothetical protein